MGFIICPECKKEISQYAELCPTCGFPIKKVMDENGLNDVTKIFICPKCASYNYGNRIRCSFCNSMVVQTEINCDVFEKLNYTQWKAGNEHFDSDLAKKYGNNQFSQEAYDERLVIIRQENDNRKQQREQQKKQEQSIPRCSKCGCTEFVPMRKKFSFLTGFATNKIEMVCKQCGTVIK